MSDTTKNGQRERGRQTRSRGAPGSAAGKGVDWRGGPVVDPTENVLALVDAESRYQNGMREWQNKYQDGMRQAENRRLDDLAELRVRYEARMSDVLTVQVKTTSELISAQLEKVTSALGTQITSLGNSLADRIGQLERFRWEVGGRTSVQDPAVADAIARLTGAIGALQETRQESHGKTMGRGEVVAWVVAAASVLGFLFEALKHQ